MIWINQLTVYSNKFDSSDRRDSSNSSDSRDYTDRSYIFGSIDSRDRSKNKLQTVSNTFLNKLNNQKT